MRIKIVHLTGGNPPLKLADVELEFGAGSLEGLKLIGFSVWERRNGQGYNVTFPARQYSVNGERRAFALLRPIVDAGASDRLRDQIIAAYLEEVAERAASVADEARTEAAGVAEARS
jgi:hypothetical protein